MKRFCIIFSLLCFGSSGCLCGGLGLECKVKITQDYVFFDHCYNGLLINELQVKDTEPINLYPHNYTKRSGILMQSLDSAPMLSRKNRKVYFKDNKDNFRWEVYNCSDYDSMSCYFSGSNYTVTEAIELFRPGTWYLFNFFNPHFEVFVHCDRSGKLTFRKKHLNPNF